MFDTFVVPTNFQCDINELGDFFDFRYRDRELPDEFFFENVPAALLTENDVFLSKSYDIEGGGLVRKVVLPDCAQEDFHIELGPRNTEVPYIYIEPDYIPGLITLQWYFDFSNSDSPIPLPDIPRAMPTVPPQAKETPPSIAIFDDFFSEREGLIFAPYYQFTQTNPSSKYVVGDLEEEVNIQLNSKMQRYNYSFCFSSKYPFYPSFYRYGYKLIWMEFNPFHPLSPRYIVKYVENGTVISGVYKWGRKEKTFSFDRNDTKYRIHSEVWSRLFPQAHPSMGVFDIVGNYDFLSDIPELGSIPVKLFKYPGRYAEMVRVEGNVDIYSPMINPRSNKGNYYPFFSNCPVDINTVGMTEYYNISERFSVECFMNDIYSVRIMRNRDNHMIGEIKIGGKSIIDDRYFVVYTMKGNLGVYIEACNILDELQGDPVPDTLCHKLLLEGVYYQGQPRNNRGTIINPLGVSDYGTFFRHTRECVMSYFDTAPLTDKSSAFSDSFQADLKQVVDHKDVNNEHNIHNSVLDDDIIVKDKDKGNAPLELDSDDEIKEVITVPEIITKGSLFFNGQNYGVSALNLTEVGRQFLLHNLESPRSHSKVAVHEHNKKLYDKRSVPPSTMVYKGTRYKKKH